MPRKRNSLDLFNTFYLEPAHVHWNFELPTYLSWFLVYLQDTYFTARVIYDLAFFFLLIIIVLNLIFGVIIDTFADLRSEKQTKEEVLKNTCFICGMHSCPSIVSRYIEFSLHQMCFASGTSIFSTKLILPVQYFYPFLSFVTSYQKNRCLQ